MRSGGGEVTHELGIIDAVAGRLTPAQLARLSGSPSVTRIYDDPTLRTASITATFRDELNAIAYNGDDGSAGWSSDWQDNDSQYPGPIGGTIYVVDIPACPSAGSTYCLAFEANKGHSVTREVDLSAAASATLTYAYAHEPLGGLVRILVEVSSDGGQSWTVLKSYSADTQADGSETFDLSSYLASNTQIRFRDAQDLGKKLYIDDVQIEYNATPDTDYPTLIGADQLHAQGIDGTGVTVAVVDTGYWSHPDLDNNSNGLARVLAQYDAIADQMDTLLSDTDSNGHASHVSSISATIPDTSAADWEVPDMVKWLPPC